MKKVCAGLVAIWAGVFLFTPFASATALPPGTPPSPTAYYYGDADGDTLLTTFDLGILNNIFNGQSYTFFTLQPDNPNDDWNTADIDSDDLLTTFDLGYYSQYFNGQALDLPDRPWIIEGVNLNASYATTGLFFPFNGNVSAYNGDRGRAGVAVVAEILPVGSGSTTTGSLSGRDCAPTGVDDPADVGAQCALAITITDWQTNMILGLTEDGTYGLEVMADAVGTIAIQLSVSDNGLGIEAPTISTTVFTHFIGILNHAPTWQTAPSNITITSGSIYGPTTNGILTDNDTGQTLTCSPGSTNCVGITYNYVGSGVVPPDLSCTFAVDASAAAPQTCEWRLVGSDDGAPALTVGATIVVHITNKPPTWQTAPSNITITGGLVYNNTNGVARDLYAGMTITCSSGGTSCIGFTPTVSGSAVSPALANCNVAFTAPVPAQTCQLRIMATDTGVPPKSVGSTITITIRNHGPMWQTVPSDIAITGGSVYDQTNGVVGDPDTGQTLTCSSGGSTCVGFTPVVSGTSESPLNCNVSFTAPSSFSDCNLRVRASDNGSPAMTTGRTITISGNHKPIWQTGPTNITITSGSVYNSINGVIADQDAGQTLTCSVYSTTCVGMTFTYSGSGPSPVNCQLSFTAGSSQACTLRLRGSDNYTPVGRVDTTIVLSINVAGWVQVGTGSAWGGGISGNSGSSYNPSLILDSFDNPVVAWFDNTSGNNEIYIKRWDGSAWTDVGTGSSSGGGISNNSGSSSYPSLVLDSADNPVVAWFDDTSGNNEIYIKRWDGSAWVDVGTGSSSGGGISNNSGASSYPTLALDSSDNPVVAWQDLTSGDYEIYIRRWDGSAWVDVGTGSSSGGGISNNSGASGYPSLGLDNSDNPVVAWDDDTTLNLEIYIKRWDGSAWMDIGEFSSSAGGISNTWNASEHPSLALDSSGNPFVAWQDNTSVNYEIYIKHWDGSGWVEVGTGSSSGGGISSDSHHSLNPSLVIDYSDYPVVAWYDYTTENNEIFITRWDGSAWVDIGSGSSSGGGISSNLGRSRNPSVALDSTDNPFVTWEDSSYANYEIYIKRYQP